MVSKRLLLFLKQNLIGLILLVYASSPVTYANAAVIQDSEFFQAKRDRHYFMVELKKAHHVLSTSNINGGLSNQLTYLVNHQSMEANNHTQQLDLILSSSKQAYHSLIAKDLNISAKKMALMGTAAQMNNIGHHQAQFKDLTVDAFVTAGVSGNAMRAGEETKWYQTTDGNKKVDFQGTINIIVLINRPVSAGALSKVSMLLTEAKSAALSQLAVSSRFSSHLATGTGTDQFIIASPAPAKESFVYQSASGHLKLGELIGTAVRHATLQALMWQNRLAPKDTASVTYALARFGLSEKSLLKHLQETLPEETFHLAEANLQSINQNTRLVAVAYAYAALLDRFQYQTLPNTIKTETLKDSAATAAVALSGDTLKWDSAWQKLSTSTDNPIELFLDAVAMGWQAKWQS